MKTDTIYFNVSTKEWSCMAQSLVNRQSIEMPLSEEQANLLISTFNFLEGDTSGNIIIWTQE